LKTITAILFLFLMQFNLIGYQLCFYYVQKQADLELQATLDKQHYNRDDLITLRVPLALPYQTDWKEFERVNGEIEINGKVYKYVERKIVNGEMVLLCIPDNNRSRLENAKEEFFRLANSLQTDTPNKTSDEKATSIFKCIHTAFENCQCDWQTNLINRELSLAPKVYNISLPQVIISLPGQPPDYLSVI
jgi:hypothetical protein